MVTGTLEDTIHFGTNGNRIDAPKRIEFDAIPEWVTSENRKGLSKKIAEWYTSYYFWASWTGREDELHEYVVLSRARANAILKALKKSADMMIDFENAFVEIGVQAKREGAWQYAEYDSPSEMFQVMLEEAQERSPRSGRVTELRDLITIIDQLEKLGVPSEYILPMPHQVSKSRRAKYALEDILDSELPQEEKLEAVKDILVDVADPELPVRAFEEKINQRMGKVHKAEVEPAPASFYILGGGKELIAVWSNSRAQTGAIQSRLQGLTTEIAVGDPADLMKVIGASVSPKSQGLVGHRYDSATHMLEQFAGGFKLPLPDAMAFLIDATVAKYLPILLQVNTTVDVPIFEFGRGIADAAQWIEKNLGGKLSDDEKKYPEGVLSAAVGKYYQIPQDTRDFLGESRVAILDVVFQNGVLAIVLKVVT